MTTAHEPLAVSGVSNTPGAYVVGIEWVRLVGCVAIIAFHLRLPGRQLALGGLHAFTALTVALAAGSARRRGGKEFALARFQTLGVPWLFWCVFYALFAAVEGLRAHESPFAWVTPWSWLVGPSTHLWFLPFALLTALLVAPVVRRFQGERAWLFWFAASLPAMAITAYASRVSLPEPFGQWLSVLPSAVLGVCLAQLPAGSRLAWPQLAVVTLGASAACAAAIALGYASTFVALLAGIAPTAIAWGSPKTTGPRLRAWSRLSLGVYVLHVFIGRLVYKPLVASPWLFLLVTTLFSFGCTWVLRRLPVLNRFV